MAAVEPRNEGTRAGWRAYAFAAALVGAATLGALFLRGRIELTEIVMIYLLAIVLVALLGRRAPALFAAGASVLLFDLLFVPPYGTLGVENTHYVLTFAMMLTVGLVIGTLTGRVREQADAAGRRELRIRTEELRNALLSSVSHDLRTPLAAIQGAATALLEGADVDAVGGRDLLVTIREESERLERLVSNLLDMTRVEAGIKPDKQWIPLEEVVGSAVRRTDKRLAGRPLTVDLPQDALVPMDDVLMENVLVNLLENAARHTPDGTPIEIRGRVGVDRAVLEVLDRGPGFPAGADERVFEKFWQAGSLARPNGVGLGLTICRGIVHAHGGTITAHAREGGGASFRIELPIETAAPEIPAERREDA
jgi:K+-sensing histidine kinase KdpD